MVVLATLRVTMQARTRMVVVAKMGVDVCVRCSKKRMFVKRKEKQKNTKNKKIINYNKKNIKKY